MSGGVAGGVRSGGVAGGVVTSWCGVRSGGVAGGVGRCSGGVRRHVRGALGLRVKGVLAGGVAGGVLTSSSGGDLRVDLVLAPRPGAWTRRGGLGDPWT